MMIQIRYFASLREALGAAGAMVETVRGAGYRLTAQPQALLRA